jgi:Lon protease-like protein
MPAFHPSFDALPTEIPVFPLPGALLLPQGRLPLNIFESRYLSMVTDALGAGRMFGMIQPRPDGPRTANGPGLYGVGCLGRLTSFAETEDGRFLITLTGVIRFGLVEEIAMRRGYRRVRADYAPWRTDLDTEAPPPSLDRAALLHASCAYFRARGIEVNYDAVEKAADAMLVTTLSMVCPFEVREKQALLEAPDTSERARMLVALLQMGAHGRGATPPGGGRPS